nr:MAG TPA: hypothetical protein [Caudoviricetes sp.]
MARRKYLRIVLIEKLIHQADIVMQYLDQRKVLTRCMLPYGINRITKAQESCVYTKKILNIQKRYGKKFTIIQDSAEISISNWNAIKW